MRALPTILAAALLTACGGPGGASATSGACTAETLCLRTIGTRPAPLMPGRLVVVWDPLNERNGLPEVAFDVPFTGQERAIAIPYARIAPPRTLLPAMPCPPSRGPECRRIVGIAVGYVLVLGDTNGNGRIDQDEVGKHALYGAARMIVGFAQEPIEATPDLAPAGMARGIAPYAPVRPRGSFDKWQLVAPGTLFDLVVCTQGEAGCFPPVPNLT